VISPSWNPDDAIHASVAVYRLELREPQEGDAVLQDMFNKTGTQNNNRNGNTRSNSGFSRAAARLRTNKTLQVRGHFKIQFAGGERNRRANFGVVRKSRKQHTHDPQLLIADRSASHQAFPTGSRLYGCKGTNQIEPVLFVCTVWLCLFGDAGQAQFPRVVSWSGARVPMPRAARAPALTQRNGDVGDAVDSDDPDSQLIVIADEKDASGHFASGLYWIVPSPRS